MHPHTVIYSPLGKARTRVVGIPWLETPARMCRYVASTGRPLTPVAHHTRGSFLRASARTGRSMIQSEKDFACQEKINKTFCYTRKNCSQYSASDNHDIKTNFEACPSSIGESRPIVLLVRQDSIWGGPVPALSLAASARG